MEEIYIMTQHLQNMPYSDVMSMPVFERRFYLGLHTKQLRQKEEHIANLKAQAQTKNSKGSRTTRVSGESLKNKIKNGEIPLE